MKIIKFMRAGNEVRVIAFNDEQVHDTLAPAVYTLCFCKISGYYLNYHSDKFTVPSTVYGSTTRRVNKVITTYNERSSSTGILLSGDKGSGKTMTTSLIANHMISEGMPVILIEEAFSGSGFNDFLSNLGECCLYFDEFGKMYKKGGNPEQDNQTDLLSLFDGVGSLKRLIMLTENNIYDINEFMLERPGRVYYHFRHNKLDQELITEYCEAKGVPKGIINEVLMRCDTSWAFSFDTLQALVEEWTRYGGSIADTAKDLNIEQPLTRYQQMQIKSIVDINTNESFEIAKNFDVVDFPTTDSQEIRWLTHEGEEDDCEEDNLPVPVGHSGTSKGVKSRYTYLSVKDTVSRSGTKVVFVCEDKKVIVTAEILPVRNAALDVKAF